MQASTSGHPIQEDLIALGEGEASAHVAAHVETCSECSYCAAEYVHMQAKLRRALYRCDCPDAHTLGEFELNMLDSELRIVVAAHASECRECVAELRMLRAYLFVEELQVD